jgi:hypothetical protein
MYIKNRQNSADLRASDSYQTFVLNRKFVAFYFPTCHILIVSYDKKRNSQWTFIYPIDKDSKRYL